MKHTHTPGPWETVKTVYCGIGIVSTHTGLAHVCNHIATPDNARLIASAPDLLAALQWYVDTYAIPESDHKLGIPHLIAGEQTARAAIAKATGGAA